jgi:cytidylate kinase
MPLEEILAQQNQRDARDTVRSVGPMVPAADAITFTTDRLAREVVIDRLEAIVRQRMTCASTSHATRRS